jgi:hypothetical protein
MNIFGIEASKYRYGKITVGVEGKAVTGFTRSGYKGDKSI